MIDSIFNLPGPEFLVFYAVFSGVVILVAHMIRHMTEGGTPPNINLMDPYLVACLRGGRSEALRVATISLLDRGLLRDDGVVLVTIPGTKELAKNKIEKDLLEYFKKPGAMPESLFGPSAPAAPSSHYEEALAQNALHPNGAIRFRRYMIIGLTCAVLLGVAGNKISLALDRGHRNIGFLVILTVAVVVFAFKVLNPLRTTLGDSTLKDIETLFADLGSRTSQIRPGGANKELAWAAAVFGVSALSLESFPFIQRIVPRVQPEGPAGWFDSGSSSCGSSCGGGCGGGCGGCGS